MTKEKTTLQLTKETMASMINEKRDQLRLIDERRREAAEQIRQADQEMQAATEKMDLDGYEAARERKKREETAVEMFEKRYRQLQQAHFVSEQESDAVIDGLLDYEKQLEADFKSAIAGPLKELDKLHREYAEAVADCEDTIKAWGQQIRPNYSTRGKMTRLDENGQRTDRAAHPVAVHATPYTGCAEAKQLSLYLQQAKKLYEVK